MIHKVSWELYSQIKIHAKEKRQEAIAYMNQLNEQKINCSSCVGTCCTFEANSMQITPLEAFELLQFLIDSKADLIEIQEKIESSIQQYRLEPNYGHSNLRKNYTCPFFDSANKKCQISRHAKPIGCLAFNPIEQNIQNGGTCKSNVDILLEAENEFKQYNDEMNQKIKNIFNIHWLKAPIPIALKEILKKS